MRYDGYDPYGVRAHNARIGNPRTVAHSPRYYFWQKLVRGTFRLIWAIWMVLGLGFIAWCIIVMLIRVVFSIV